MVGNIVVAHLAGGEVVVGRLELRGIYGPAYGIWIVGEHGERSINWPDVDMLLKVGGHAVVLANVCPPADDVPLAVPAYFGKR